MEKFLHMQKLLGFARRAIDDYGMISSGDRIAVGVSGGKDSLTLLAALRGLQKFYPAEFEIVPITLDMGFDGGDTCAPAELCRRLELEHTVVKTDIYRIVFEIRKCDSPCSLCAKLRRGALHDAALANGCSKVALGHHFDDAVETFMLNLFNEGRIGCFAPVTYLDRKKSHGDTSAAVYARTFNRYTYSRRQQHSRGAENLPCGRIHGPRTDKANACKTRSGRPRAEIAFVRSYGARGGQRIRNAYAKRQTFRL